MNVWKSLSGYPTIEDISYEISSYLYKEGKEDFSFSTLNSLYGKDWKETKHFSLVEDMIESKLIEKTEKKLGGNDWYKIINKK